MTAQDFKDKLAQHASDADAIFLQRFFKTAPDEYGEGDIFIGVRVPMTRKVCRDFKTLPLAEIEQLLYSPIHEHRLAATIIMSGQYKKADFEKQQHLFDLYLKALRDGRINNWDILLQARAVENQAYVCGVNCVGTDGLGIDYNGHSTLLDFKATPLLSFPENETSIQTYELNREPLLKFREKSAFWKDADKFEII